MKQKLAILALFVVAVGAIVAVALKRGDDKPAPSSGTKVTTTPQGGDPADKPPGPASAPVEIVFAYSTEKKEWVEAAVAGFREAHPEITVKLVSKGSLEAAEAINDETEKPTLWSPADSMVLNLFASDWETKHGKPPFATSGDDAPQPLLLTPLVFAVWEDRAEVLLAASGGNLSWKAIHKAVSSPQGWPAIGGKKAWGLVKLGHTDPTRSNSGLQALLLMTLEYYGKRSGLEVGDLLDEKYQAWMRDIERAVPKFEASTGTFMTDMIRFGPSKYDVAVVYESLAVSQLENAQGRWGSGLRVYYPATTVWSDHPVAILDAAWVTPAQRTAAAALVAHLRSERVQQTALRYGFRPADPNVKVVTAEAGNPFAKLAKYGVLVELPEVAQPPEGPVIRNLLMVWSRLLKTK